MSTMTLEEINSWKELSEEGSKLMNYRKERSERGDRTAHTTNDVREAAVEKLADLKYFDLSK